MVAVVQVPRPDEKEGLYDPLDNNGSNILVFFRETNLDEKLDALRVS